MEKKPLGSQSPWLKGEDGVFHIHSGSHVCFIYIVAHMCPSRCPSPQCARYSRYTEFYESCFGLLAVQARQWLFPRFSMQGREDACQLFLTNCASQGEGSCDLQNSVSPDQSKINKESGFVT